MYSTVGFSLFKKVSRRANWALIIMPVKSLAGDKSYFYLLLLLSKRFKMLQKAFKKPKSGNGKYTYSEMTIDHRENLYRDFFAQMDQGFCILEMLFDQDMRPVDYRFMADNISQLAWITDEKGYIFWYNQRWFNYTGTTLDEMKGWGWTKVHHPEHVDRVVKKINRCFAEGRSWEDTFPLRGKDGEYRWFLSRAVAIRNSQGEITNWFGTNTDITDQLKASEELSYQKGLLEAQHKTSPMGILVVDPERKILMYNRRFEEIHGIEGIDLIGRHESILRDETKHLFEATNLPETALERIYSTRAQNHDKLYFKDGRIIEWFGTPVLGEKGAYFGYAFSYIDVTKQETLLRQKDEFLGVASHELKTPVTSILAYTQLLQRQFERS